MDQKNKIVKTTILPKSVCRFNVMPIKSPMTLFIDTEKTNKELIMKYKIG
jgi:hypothetical protein